MKVSFSDDANNNRMKMKNDTATATTTPTTSAIKKKSGAVKNLVKKRSSILTKTSYFTKIVNSAFDKVDVDKSGGVTLEELYSGLLLIHLQMAIYVGAPACRVSLFCSCFFAIAFFS